MPKETRSTAMKRRLDFEEPHSDVAHLTRQHKREIKSLLSPQKKKDKAFTTPTKKARIEESKEEPYVPTYIHKNLEYLRKGEATLSEITRRTFALVEEHFHLPEDLDKNRKYGPLSGSCFEKRAITAYSMGELEVKNPEADGIMICTACAAEGHKRSSCPTLI